MTRREEEVKVPRAGLASSEATEEGTWMMGGGSATVGRLRKGEYDEGKGDGGG